jgi:hypothetical protein
MKTCMHLYLAELFLWWDLLQSEVVETVKTYVLFSVTLLSKSCRLLDNVGNWENMV